MYSVFDVAEQTQGVGRHGVAAHNPGKIENELCTAVGKQVGGWIHFLV